MYRTYKRKLKLTKEQERRLMSWMGCCRLVYNMGLQIQKDSYRAFGKSVSKYALMKQITEIRKIYPWVQDVSVDCLQESIERLDKAFNSFFRGRKKGVGFPKFAAKGKVRSVNFKRIKIINGDLFVAKIGYLNIFKDSPLLGVPKTAAIILEPTGVFLLVKCKDVPVGFVSENQAIGLDMGISHFCIDSNGRFIGNPRHFKRYERRLRVENRALSRKKKGSNCWKKQAKRIALLYYKVRNIRRDFLHKESTRIAKENTIVYMEDLNVSAMAKNRNLSKHILDAGWGQLRVMLSYKTQVVLVNPRHTSQTCSECGAVDAASRISQAEFKCTMCGHTANADHNAAKNILSRGTALSRQREALACA